MKTRKIKFAVVWLFLMAVTIQAQTTSFTYQGKLNDAGQPANANYDMQFRLWDNPNSGQGMQQGLPITRPSVAVSNGLFNVELDFGALVFASGMNLYLEISLRPAGSAGGYTSLNPRQKLTSAPYSVRAVNAVTADGLSGACVSCVQDAHINSVDGSRVTGAVANATNAANATTAENVSGIVAIGNGGTGSATQNFVDLTSDQTIDGNKTFNGTVSATALSGNGSGLTSLFQIQRFGGNIGTMAATGSTFVFVGGNNATTTVTVNGSQRITGSGVATLGTNSGGASVGVSLCYQSTSGGSVTPFTSGGYSVPNLTTSRSNVAVAETTVPAAGEYRVGYCIFTFTSTFSNNEFVQGWVMVTNN